MSTKHIQSIISSGESLTVEFKESKAQLNKDIYETVCALNGKVYDGNNDSDINIIGQSSNIAKVFREIGFADELGSGVKNLYKYAKAYGGSDPMIVEGEVFRVEVRILEATQKTTRELVFELLSVDGKMTRENLAQKLGVSTNAIKQHLSKLQAEGRLERIGGRKDGLWKVKND